MLERNIRLTLTRPEFLVIYELLVRVRLGNRNHFESSISDLMAELDDAEVFKLLVGCEHQYGIPQISVEASDEEGMVFNIS